MPAFVVELGLNYEVATHLKPDHDKFINSGYSKSIQDKQPLSSTLLATAHAQWNT